MKADVRTCLVVALGLALGTPACSRNDVVDFAMRTAPRPAHAGDRRERRVGDRLVVAGDMHCHVLPPDAPYHVSRDFDATVALAREEGLDFVVLTPHVSARFFTDPHERAWVRRTQRELRARIAAADADGPLLVPGFEYTDHRYGHVGASFADVEEVLADLEAAEVDLRAHPEAFFERWVARGGILVVNHPVQLPMPAAPVLALRYDMSFRALLGREAPAEMRWIADHAHGIETFNASITHLRDHLVLEDTDRSRRHATWLLDRAARTRAASGRVVGAVGGSDSHGAWLRPTTWVLVADRGSTALREGLQGGRTCAGGPDTCRLQVRAPDGEWRGVGDELAGGRDHVFARLAPEEGEDPRAETTFFVDGQPVATARGSETVVLPVRPDRCALVRATRGASWSSHVRVGCR